MHRKTLPPAPLATLGHTGAPRQSSTAYYVQPDSGDEVKLRNPEMRRAWLQIYSALLNGVAPDKTDDRDWGVKDVAGFCACLADEALEQYRRRR